MVVVKNGSSGGKIRLHHLRWREAVVKEIGSSGGRVALLAVAAIAIPFFSFSFLNSIIINVITSC